MKTNILLIASILVFNISTANCSTVLEGTSEGMRYRVEEVAAGFGVIWGFAFIDDNTLLFTERSGTCKILDIASGRVREISGVPNIWAKGQGGMLDVALPPEYRASEWIYLTYSREQNGKGVTTLARARLSGESFTDWQDLLITRSGTGTTRHFGSRIAFDNSGHVFFSVGDRGVRNNGQDISTHAGTIIRLNLDGTIPYDNPFIGKDGLDEIWSFGHRNPQGLFWQKSTGLLWSNEHGPRGGDEINIIEPGANYGWPVVSHGKEYWGPIAVGESTSKPGMRDPIKVYIPSIAPGSLIVYSGKAFPGWQGNLFSGALALTHLNRVVIKDNNVVKEKRLLENLDERIRTLAESPEGHIYLTTDSGRILRIVQ